MTDEQIVDVTFWPFVYTLHSNLPAHVNTKLLNQQGLIYVFSPGIDSISSGGWGLGSEVTAGHRGWDVWHRDWRKPRFFSWHGPSSWWQRMIVWLHVHLRRMLLIVPTTWLQRLILLDCCLLLLPCMCRYCDNWRIMREWAATSTRSLRFPWPDTESTGRRLSLCSETQWVKCGIWQVSLIPRLCGGEKSRMRLTRLCCVVFLPLQQIKWKWISTYWLNCGIFS